MLRLRSPDSGRNLGLKLVSRPLSDFPAAPTALSELLPAAAHLLAPSGEEEAAEMLRSATDERARVMFHGHGTRQGMGGELEPDVVMSTAHMDRIIRWEPDDLTLVVESGASVRVVESELGERGQTAGLPEWDDAGTIGGVVATGSSGYRRARLGPTRDRLLEVRLVTGDGRVIHGGGRVVKNVSGYDLPRLATGSMGRLGLIASVCLKLWPLPEASATVELEVPPAVAWRRLYRPLAVLETPTRSLAMLQGTEAEVSAQVGAVAGQVREGLDWPPPPAGDFACSVRIRPSDLTAAVREIPAHWDWVAQHGVGLIEAACDRPDPEEVLWFRSWAEERGGSLVILRPGGIAVDPWGRPPAALDLQRRILSGFDPYGIANPGRLPGGI